MKTQSFCALALALTTACLPDLNTQGGAPDVSLDASADAPGDTDVTPDADASVVTYAFAFDVPNGSLRIGVTGSENTRVAFINDAECAGSPSLSTVDQGVISFRDDEPSDSSALLSPAGAGVGVLRATCGTQTAALEVIVLPVSSERLADVRLWSRGDIGVEHEDAGDNEKPVLEWRNLAQASPRFARLMSTAPPRFDDGRGDARLSFRVPASADGEENPVGLALLDEDELFALEFGDGMTALFVVETTKRKTHTLLKSASGGDYSVFMDTNAPLRQKLGVSAKAEGSDGGAEAMFEQVMPSRLGAGGAAFGLVMARSGVSVTLTPYPADPEMSESFTIAAPEAGYPIFSVETLGLGRPSSAGDDRGLDGHVYEVLIIDAALAPGEVAQALEAMKKQVSF